MGQATVVAVHRSASHGFSKFAIAEVTGLRNPCSQIDRFQPGLMAAVLGRDSRGKLARMAGVMAIVVATGEVRTGDPIRVESVPLSYTRLAPV